LERLHVLLQRGAEVVEVHASFAKLLLQRVDLGDGVGVILFALLVCGALSRQLVARGFELAHFLVPFVLAVPACRRKKSGADEGKNQQLTGTKFRGGERHAEGSSEGVGRWA